MAVRFKFRSSLHFEWIEIDGKTSISIRDLKSKIVRKTRLYPCDDFHLVFSDPETGQELGDEDFQIASGSSVIVKRVPGKLCHSDVVHGESLESNGHKGAGCIKSTSKENAQSKMLDDFGTEIFVPDKYLNVCTRNVNDIEIPRCFNTSFEGAQKLNESINVDCVKRDDGNMPMEKANPKAQEYPRKPENLVAANPQAMRNSHLPEDLRCSLCTNFFEEAVMISCCHHSFCEKCVRKELDKTGRCPMCSSTKSVLLPNISLRKTVRHFLESEILINAEEIPFDRYAPDGESGIQAKHGPGAVSVSKHGADMLHSSTSTQSGSNIVIEEPVPKSKLMESRQDAHCSDKNVLFRTKFDDFQGVSLGYMEEGLLQKRKANKLCYSCGSATHYARQCPQFSLSHPSYQIGNHPMFVMNYPTHVPPYWGPVVPYSQFMDFTVPMHLYSFGGEMVPYKLAATGTEMRTAGYPAAPNPADFRQHGAYHELGEQRTATDHADSWHGHEEGPGSEVQHHRIIHDSCLRSSKGRRRSRRSYDREEFCGDYEQRSERERRKRKHHHHHHHHPWMGLQH